VFPSKVNLKPRLAKDTGALVNLGKAFLLSEHREACPFPGIPRGPYTGTQAGSHRPLKARRLYRLGEKQV